MGTPVKQAANLAAIRALCGLGLPGEQLIPALLEALHRAIPSSRNLFDWTDEDGNLVRYFFEGPIDAEVARHYFAEFHNRKESPVMGAFRDAVLGKAVVRGAGELDRPEFFRSDLYNEVWRPQRLHTRIEAIVRGAGGRPLGSLVLYREPGDPKFTREEERLLGDLVPYVARGLESESALAPDFVARPDRRAVLSMGLDGRLLHVSEHAHRMLLLAHGGITPEGAGRVPDLKDFATLSMLAAQIRSHEGASKRQVTLTVDNAWGRFVFEAEPLRPADGGGPAAVHVSIQHQEPRAVAWRRALGALHLSIAQTEVCALMRAGYTQSQIAAALGIAPSTVADHVKKIYARLDVHSARELCARVDELVP
ncbi:MAG TPA: helix-turn-helix transcriptional regulator [Usitatibacteraceae bacterium]|nr:helix-turn-helix transcriptional regulator [Usitatibacteraceae bacterium]